eukprot:Rhum_TRINITY_DN14652_c5_g1::Rhum_TRINITY_DN14652_c5_g1_i1::g.105874::m.105874
MVSTRAASASAENVGGNTPLWRRRRTTLALAQLFLCAALYAVVSTAGWSTDPAPHPARSSPTSLLSASTPSPHPPTPAPPLHPQRRSPSAPSSAAPTDAHFDALAALAGPLSARLPPAPFLNANATVLGHPSHAAAQEAYRTWVHRVSGGRLAASGGDSSTAARGSGKGKGKSKPRGNSLPFVTGDAFRELALWSGGGRCCVCDEGGCCTGATAEREEEARLLAACRVFFVKTELLEDFLDSVLE